MIKSILSDLSFVLLYPKDSTYQGTLNNLYDELVNGPAPFIFQDHFIFNQELFKFYKSLRETVEFNLFTSGRIQDDPQIKATLLELFDEIFSAQDLGLPKTQAESYQTLADMLSTDTKEILYIDDSEMNLKSAKAVGMQTIQHVNNPTTIESIKLFLQ